MIIFILFLFFYIFNFSADIHVGISYNVHCTLLSYTNRFEVNGLNY